MGIIRTHDPPLKHVYRRISSDMLLFFPYLFLDWLCKGKKERNPNGEEVGNCFARMLRGSKWIYVLI